MYIYHLLWTIAGVNAFADYTRNIPCGLALDADAASAVFDSALAVSTIFHMIEWIRWTCFLTSALVAVNLIPLFYALAVVNIPFGVLSFIMALATRYSEDGTACSVEGAQETRAFYLSLQMVCLVVHFPLVMIHAVYFKVRGIEWMHKMFLREEGDEEKEEAEKKALEEEAKAAAK